MCLPAIACQVIPELHCQACHPCCLFAVIAGLMQAMLPTCHVLIVSVAPVCRDHVPQHVVQVCICNTCNPVHTNLLRLSTFLHAQPLQSACCDIAHGLCRHLQALQRGLQYCHHGTCGSICIHLRFDSKLQRAIRCQA